MQVPSARLKPFQDVWSLSLPGDPTGTPDGVSICPACTAPPRHQVPSTH